MPEGHTYMDGVSRICVPFLASAHQGRIPRQPSRSSRVGRDEEVIRSYIQQQEQEDKRLDQLNLQL